MSSPRDPEEEKQGASDQSDSDAVTGEVSEASVMGADNDAVVGEEVEVPFAVPEDWEESQKVPVDLEEGGTAHAEIPAAPPPCQELTIDHAGEGPSDSEAASITSISLDAASLTASPREQPSWERVKTRHTQQPTRNKNETAGSGTTEWQVELVDTIEKRLSETDLAIFRQLEADLRAASTKLTNAAHEIQDLTLENARLRQESEARHAAWARAQLQLSDAEAKERAHWEMKTRMEGVDALFEEAGYVKAPIILGEGWPTRKPQSPPSRRHADPLRKFRPSLGESLGGEGEGSVLPIQLLSAIRMAGWREGTREEAPRAPVPPKPQLTAALRTYLEANAAHMAGLWPHYQGAIHQDPPPQTEREIQKEREGKVAAWKACAMLPVPGLSITRSPPRKRSGSVMKVTLVDKLAAEGLPVDGTPRRQLKRLLHHTKRSKLAAKDKPAADRLDAEEKAASQSLHDRLEGEGLSTVGTHHDLMSRLVSHHRGSRKEEDGAGSALHTAEASPDRWGRIKQKHRAKTPHAGIPEVPEGIPEVPMPEAPQGESSLPTKPAALAETIRKAAKRRDKEAHAVAESKGYWRGLKAFPGASWRRNNSHFQGRGHGARRKRSFTSRALMLTLGGARDAIA